MSPSRTARPAPSVPMPTGERADKERTVISATSCFTWCLRPAARDRSRGWPATATTAPASPSTSAFAPCPKNVQNRTSILACSTTHTAATTCCDGVRFHAVGRPDLLTLRLTRLSAAWWNPSRRSPPPVPTTRSRVQPPPIAQLSMAEDRAHRGAGTAWPPVPSSHLWERANTHEAGGPAP
jgi:hypothetical protein